MTDEARSAATTEPRKRAYENGETIWQRECPYCDRGLLLAPVRFCQRCQGSGYLTTTVDPSAASPSRVALAVKGWRCWLGWHRWNVSSVVGRYISGRGFDGAYEVYQECARCGEERSYMEWNRRVGAKLEEAVRGR